MLQVDRIFYCRDPSKAYLDSPQDIGIKTFLAIV
jgi:hypothetical protein